jgi:hypothetical protein
VTDAPELELHGHLVRSGVSSPLLTETLRERAEQSLVLALLALV